MKSKLIVYDTFIDYWDAYGEYSQIVCDTSSYIETHKKPCRYSPSGYKVVYTYHFGLKGSVIDHRTSI